MKAITALRNDFEKIRSLMFFLAVYEKTSGVLEKHKWGHLKLFRLIHYVKKSTVRRISGSYVFQPNHHDKRIPDTSKAEILQIDREGHEILHG